MATVFHADDFGITEAQARSILALSDACGGSGAIQSVSIFTNSPAFEASCALARPYVESGALRIGPHINLVEGPSIGHSIKHGRHGGLVDQGGMLALDFVSLLRGALAGEHTQEALAGEVFAECRAQIARFCEAFPEERDHLRLDSHQHVHMIPFVFDAMMNAAAACGCTVTDLRVSAEPLGPHLAAAPGRLASVNAVKNGLLGFLAPHVRHVAPKTCRIPVFCGVMLSGRMDEADAALIARMEDIAAKHGRDLEILTHPIAMQRQECLDPDKTAFAEACCADGRSREAAFDASWHIGPDGRAVRGGSALI